MVQPIAPVASATAANNAITRFTAELFPNPVLPKNMADNC
jgi:hypothetical protein